MNIQERIKTLLQKAGLGFWKEEKPKEDNTSLTNRAARRRAEKVKPTMQQPFGKLQSEEKVEDQYFDVLQNIEFGIVKAYRQQPTLVDFDVEMVFDALIRGYQAEVQQQQGKVPMLNEVRQALYDSVKAMCDWRLGRQQMTTKDENKAVPIPKALTPEEIIVCLKRIRKSVQTWNKRGGRRGYLTFVQEFIR